MKYHKAIIVGTGFSGICQSIKLKQAGFNEFIILEKANAVGGTWRENTYPGAECDIPSALYSYSFEHNPNWLHKWSRQDQIIEYINHCVQKYNVGPHIRFHQELTTATYVEDTGKWKVYTKTDEFLTDSLIVAIGQLHHPSTPVIDGQMDFEGLSWHSAQWNHDADLRGKRVGVIGNAASAVQFIPEIAKEVSDLTIFQRSANWMLPKVEPETAEWRKKLNSKFLLLTKMNRFRLWLTGGMMFFLMGENRLAKKVGRWYSLSKMKRHIKDPELQEKLTPDYPIGAKRILFSDNYYPAITRTNVHIETDAIERFIGNSIVTKSGKAYPLDIAIYATGFVTNPFLKGLHIVGREGSNLQSKWENGAEAYLGITVSGFPNFYMLYGPNTNLGHNSIIIMSEAQSDYITQCLLMKESKRWDSIEVKSGAQKSFNEEIQQRLQHTAWNQLSHSWYRIDGKITNNWPGRTMEYTRRTKRVKWSDYKCS